MAFEVGGGVGLRNQGSGWMWVGLSFRVQRCQLRATGASGKRSI